MVNSVMMGDSVVTEELCGDKEALMQWRDSDVMGKSCMGAADVKGDSDMMGGSHV